jgi:hypothetical protein
MFDVYLRFIKDKAYVKFISNLFLILRKYNITPNHITYIGFILGLVCTYFCYLKNIYFAFIFWALNRFIDGLDGNINELKLNIRCICKRSKYEL